MELLMIILEDLSIAHLMQFRRCNRSTADLIDSEPLLGSTLRFAPNVLKGLVALRITIPVTAGQVRRKCAQRSCDGCGGLAQSLYLPTFQRACFPCLRLPGGMAFGPPVSPWEMVHQFEIQPQDFDSIPSFRFLPVSFTNGTNVFRINTPHTLYDCESVCRKRSETNDDYKAHLNDEQWAEREAFLDREIDLDRIDRSRPPITEVSAPAPEWIRLHMAVVFAPWIDSGRMEAEQGFYCASCLYTLHQYISYTRETFWEHYEHCRVSRYSRSRVRYLQGEYDSTPLEVLGQNCTARSRYNYGLKYVQDEPK